MILIPPDLKPFLQILAGDPEQLDQRPAAAWDPLRLAFLGELSRALRALPEIRTLTDLASFAFWCRPANLETLRRRFGAPETPRAGLGRVLHICPSNVPVNSGFSLAFGLLAGNNNIVRLPSRESPTLATLTEQIGLLLRRPEHAPLRGAILLLRYDRNDAVTQFWSSLADGRVIWGGDETVQSIRRMPSPPRCRDVAFPDRYSLCVLEPSAILALDDQQLAGVCQRLYNDIYLMDQAACSSPQLVVWVGDPVLVTQAQAKLWPALADHAERHYRPQPIQVMDKFVDACAQAATDAGVVAVHRHGTHLFRLEIEKIALDQEQRRGYGGTLHEVILASLDELGAAITERYQTLTYFGYGRDALEAFATACALRGIDRIVPVGQALEMDLVWDGYNVVDSLSRRIDIR